MGQYDAAAERLRQPLPESTFNTLFGIRYLYARGSHRLATGGCYAALDDFLACGDMMRRWGVDVSGFVPWRTGAAVACIDLGRERAARRLAEEERENSAASPRSLGLALCVLARLSDSSDSGRRLAMLRQAVDLLQTAGDRLEQARALSWLSDAQRDAGEHPRSRMTARLAVQLAEECGAEPLVRQMFQLRRGRGVAEAAPERVDADSPGYLMLTEAERRVADLAAIGYTNREIGAKLYITASTVEQHLTRIYRKLGVKSRADLPGVIQRRPGSALLGDAKATG